MIEIHATDYVLLQEFGRAWRFSDPKCQVLQASVADLRPLSRARAATLNSILQEAGSVYHLGTKAPAADIDAAAEGEEAANRISRALIALPIADDQRVIVSWDANDALETSWRTFHRCWDEFCYPSSDDVTVCPLDRSWILRYHHWARFSFSLTPHSAQA